MWRQFKCDLTAQGHSAVVKLLLARGADANAQDSYGFGAAHYAATEGDVNMLALLIASRKVNMLAETSEGATAAHCAARGGHLPALRALLELSELFLSRADQSGASVAAAACEADGGRVEM
jgi:ankyrin repeat protein